MRYKGGKETENIPAIKDYNGRIITDLDKANLFNSYYSTVFSSEDNIQHMRGGNIGEPFTIDIKIVRRMNRAISKMKLVGPDRISGEVLTLVGEAIIPYLAQLLDITMNDGTLPGDWKRATVVTNH
jgi:hypothetical protein